MADSDHGVHRVTSPEPVKKPYHPPVLTPLGSLREMTASGSKNGTENQGNVLGNKP